MISKEQFLKYIKTFNKNPGEYTKEEIFEICYLHRELKSGKSWKELVEILGLNDEYPDSLRRKTLNEIKKKNPIVKPEEIEKRFNAFIGDETNIKDLDQQFEELYKEKTKVRDIWNAYRRGLREDARTESWQDRIVEAIEELNKNHPLRASITNHLTNNSNDLENEAVLLLSDLHIGVKFNSFYNNYNLEIAKERIHKLVLDTVKYCQNNKVKRLNVLGLGDNIHGIIHTNARIGQEFDLSQQIIFASELLAQALFDLQNAAPEVIYRSVVDNHSRAVAQKENNLESENFNRVIDYILENRLHGSKIVFKKDNLDIGIGLFTLMNGKKFMFVHGHQDNINSCFQNAVGATREFIDYFAMGHYHSNKLKEYQGMTVFANGSVCGTEQYALSKRLFGDASQRLIIFDGDDTIDIKINLQEKRK